MKTRRKLLALVLTLVAISAIALSSAGALADGKVVGDKAISPMGWCWSC